MFGGPRLFLIPFDVVVVDEVLSGFLQEHLHSFGIAVGAVIPAYAGAAEVEGFDGQVLSGGQAGAEPAPLTSQPCPVTDVDLRGGVGVRQAMEFCEGLAVEAIAAARELIVLQAGFTIEPLHGDDDLVSLLMQLIDELFDGSVIGEVLDSHERHELGVEFIEPVDFFLTHDEVRIYGDDCGHGVVIDIQELGGLDVAIDEEERPGALRPKLIELSVLALGAVEVIGYGDAHDFAIVYSSGGDKGLHGVLLY